MWRLSRTELTTQILASNAELIVIEGCTGSGKTALLEEIARITGSRIQSEPSSAGAVFPDGINLIDLGTNRNVISVDDTWFSGRNKVVIAKRSHRPLAGITRMAAFGRASVFTENDLFFTENKLEAALGAEQARDVFGETLGWPVLVAMKVSGRWDEPMLAAYLNSDVLCDQSGFDLLVLSDEAHTKVRSDVPMLELNSTHRFFSGLLCDLPDHPLAHALKTAISTEITRRSSSFELARDMAGAYLQTERWPEAIRIFQNAGMFEDALAALQRASGQFFVYFHGADAFDQVLAGFPPQFSKDHDLLVFCLALQALKRGDISRARFLLTERFGELAHDLDSLFGEGTTAPLALRAFRTLMMIYEDVFLSEDLLQDIYRILPEIPSDAHLDRGSFYNSLMEFYIRWRRFDEAEDIALHAIYHYDKANAHLLIFYIRLHQAIMRLMIGDALAARKHATLAGQSLAALSFQSTNDERLLALLNACLDYESGKAEPLAHFLNVEFDAFSHGEIWPSLMEFALQYGSQALSEHFSTSAARAFLDRWRIYQVRNKLFRTMIEIREASILQNGNRWQEALEHMAGVPLRTNRTWVQNAATELERLQDRDELALALAWMRHFVYETPGRLGLDTQLQYLLDNLYLTARQRTGVQIWLAYVCKYQRDLTKARGILQKVFEETVRLGAIAPLFEERIFLKELLDNRRIAEFLSTSSSVRQVMRKLRDSGRLGSVAGVKQILSRQESKILMMISEGAANKFIANALGLSEATVKFHLGNVFRKLGCKNRQEAIQSARALGIVN